MDMVGFHALAAGSHGDELRVGTHGDQLVDAEAGHQLTDAEVFVLTADYRPMLVDVEGAEREQSWWRK